MIVFENAIAQAAWTLPSHMSMLTGLYSSRHGVINTSFRLSKSTLTLADILYERGYRTAAFTGGGFVSKKYNYHTFEVFDDSGGSSGRNFNKMLDWLNINSDEKFFLFWHNFLPHIPYTPPEEYDIFSDKNYAGIVNVDYDENEPLCADLKDDDEKYQGCIKKTSWYYTMLVDKVDETDLEHIQAKYDGDILWMDEMFREIMGRLEERGVIKKTIIIFTSDHGESFAERKTQKRIGHGIMYQEVLQVPLIIRIPGQTQHIRINSIVESVDILPTILDILDIEQPNGLDGKNLIPLIKDPDTGGVGYSEHFNNRIEYSIIHQNLKMIYKKENSGDVFELYDLITDPHERNNIFGLNKSIDEYVTGKLFSKIPEKIATTEEVVLDNKTKERRRELGYLP